MITELKLHHVTALEFLKKHPGDEIGIIDSDDKLAAAIVFSELIDAGYVQGTLLPGYGGVRLSPKREFAIAEKGTAQ